MLTDAALFNLMASLFAEQFIGYRIYLAEDKVANNIR